MILINLLPHREVKRRQRKQAFFVSVGAAVVVGLVIAGIWYLVLQQMMASQLARSQFLKRGKFLKAPPCKRPWRQPQHVPKSAASCMPTVTAIRI